MYDPRMACNKTAIFLTLAVLTTGTPALAQRAPDMATLDRGDGISKFGLDLGLTMFDDAAVYDGALRFEPYGQYVLDSGLGFYGNIPFAASFGDDDDPPGDQDAMALGSLELGLLFVIDAPTVSWVFRGGVALPTADNDPDGTLTNFAATWPRLTDVALAMPETTYARLSLSPLVHVSNFFLRADLGLDVGFDEGADEILRLNVGAGYDLGVVALALELVNIATLEDFGDDDDFQHTLALTARFMTERLEPFLAVGTPLDEGARRGVDFFIAGGIQVPLR